MAFKKELRPAARLFALTCFLTVLGACKSSQNELRVMTWTDYFRDEAIKAFESENKAKVILDYFSSNEELLAKVQANVEAGGKGYDLVLPSDYMAPGMNRLKLLSPIDKAKLPFLADFDPLFLKPTYDPELSYSVPFAYGTTGIAVNTKLAPKLNLSNGLSWKEVLENPEFKGKVTLLNDMREVFQIALIIQGTHWSKATEDDLKKAFAYLKAHKSQVKIFTEETPPVIQHDECVICQAYSGDVYRVGTGKPEIKFVLPRDGATIWTDNFAIPKNANNPELAYAFMNKMLSKEVAGNFTNSRFFATPNKKAKEMIYPQVAENPGIYPKDMSKLHFMLERTDLLKVADRLWTELKSE